MRPEFQWRLRSRTIGLGGRTLLMGVLNVTPDSFSDGGLYFDRSRAVAHGLEMLAEGADIVDIGGESTRPGSQVSERATVSAEEECGRVVPVIAEIKRQAPGAVISVDTYKAQVAREAVAAGAEIVNDVSALKWDAAMAPLVAELECGLVLMHTRGRPTEWRSLPQVGAEIVQIVTDELGESAAAAERAGIVGDSIVLDPGFGFGKNFAENYPLLARLDEMHRLGYPLLVGPSRKSFIGRSVSRESEPAPPEKRLYGTLASVTAAILKGVHIVRVHDVAPAREAAAVADEILKAEAE
ncbi:MAG: dihydropteroate synthase [Terriglobales bacterium]